MSQALSHLWCYDVTARVHNNIIACTAGFLFMPQDPSPASFHACGIWLILKKLDSGVGPPLSPCPGTASTAVRLGPASYEAADYHETNGWDPETMELGWPYPYRAYPILQIKFITPTKAPYNQSSSVLLTCPFRLRNTATAIYRTAWVVVHISRANEGQVFMCAPVGAEAAALDVAFACGHILAMHESSDAKAEKSNIWCVGVGIKNGLSGSQIISMILNKEKQIKYLRRTPNVVGKVLVLKINKTAQDIGAGYATIALRLGPERNDDEAYQVEQGWNPDLMDRHATVRPYRAYDIKSVLTFDPVQVMHLYTLVCRPH